MGDEKIADNEKEDPDGIGINFIRDNYRSVRIKSALKSRQSFIDIRDITRDGPGD